ncbi:MAG: hypothetical protein HQL39_19285 [Alphaproteobacteria bacterium]|nr:hypothetical protein [Alphaproteobacteria bacterium]
MSAKPFLHRYSVPGFGAVLLALLWLGVVDQDARLEKLRDAGFRLEMSNYVRLLEAHTRSVVRGLDQVVVHLKAVWEHDPAHFDLVNQVAISPILRGLTVQAGIIGGDGRLAASTAPMPPGPPIDLSDREHFRIHKDADSGALWVGKPVLGRASGKWSIQLARRLNQPDGSFGGVVVVSLDPNYIADIHSQIELGPESTIVVLGRDGIVRARASGTDRTVGQSYTEASFFPQLWERQEGFVRGTGPIDAIPRIRAFRRLDDYGLVVMATRPEESLRGAHLYEHRLFLAAGWGGTALILAGTILLQWQSMRQQATERRLRAREVELEQARGDLERRNEDMGQFTDILAHHLQEPVRLQHAFGQRLRGQVGKIDSPEALQSLDYILTGAERLRSLLRDVQLYVALDRAPPPEARCLIAPAVVEALRSLGDRVPRAQVTVACDDLPWVGLDRKRAVDLFAALIGNAATYRRSETPLVVRVEGTRGDGVVDISVVDNGLGIPPEYRQRVFKVFERLHPGRAFPGTGIGLPLAKKIVETAGGTIGIEDGIEGGTRIRVTLPIREDRA